MNIMRHNGISSLSEMRRLYDLSSPSLSSLGEDTFNMQPQAPVYAAGGGKGEDDYITKRLAEMRERAHRTSLERTAPAVPPGQVKMSRDEKWELEQIRKEAADYARQDALQVMQNFAEGLDYVISPELYDVSEHKEQRMEPGDESAANHWRLAFLRGAKEWDDSAKRTMSEEIWTDPRTCIYTATDNYGKPYRISGNKSFYANPEKYGFKRVSVDEVLPGDIVQTKDLTHSMTFNRYDEEGEARYNYSRGGSDPKDIVKDGYYTLPLLDKYYNVYRFVGTPADSTRWKKEFESSRFDKGGKKRETAYARKYREEQEAKAKRAIEHPTLNNVFRDDVSSETGDKYYDVINARYHQSMDALRRRGFTYEDALRLAPLMVTQNIVEGGWRVERPDDNNFGGLRESGRFLKFNSPEEYYDNYLDLLDRKWGASRGTVNNWRTAQNLDDWSRILNREDLHLWSKERYDAYNREHRDNPVYLYAPEWQNNYKSYREHLAGVEPRVNTYLDMVLEENPYPKWSDDYTVPTGGGSRANGGRLFKGGGPYGVVPLGGDYLSYLQTTPEVSGGMIEPSVVSAKLPSKFDGWSKEAIDRYAEGFTKGSRPVINKLNETGQKIFNKADRIAGFIPGPVGAIDWLGHMGYDVSQGKVKKAAKELATAAVVGAGLKTAGRGISWLRNYVDDATHFGEDTFRAFTDKTGGNIGAGFVGNTPPPSLTEEIYKVLGRAPRTVGPYEGTLLSDRGINTLADNGAFMLQDKAIIDELHKAGVSTSEMTLTDIRNLYNARLDAARNYNGKVNIISQTGGDDFTITGYTNGKPVGYIDIYGNKPSKRVPQKGFKISYVANTSGFDPSVPRERGVQQRLSDAAIMLAKDPNVGKEGLVSGMELLMPERTTKMYSRYLDKEIIRNDGVYNWLDPNGVTRSPEYGPIYLLKSPAGEPIPTKMFEYSETLPFQFDLSRFRDGRYVIEQDGIFHGDGGKIRIKPENRGKFTALKKRTGHSASWFKAHGTPAQKKMAVFALNSKKWHKKSHGGIKF